VTTTQCKWYEGNRVEAHEYLLVPIVASIGTALQGTCRELADERVVLFRMQAAVLPRRDPIPRPVVSAADQALHRSFTRCPRALREVTCGRSGPEVETARGRAVALAEPAAASRWVVDLAVDRRLLAAAPQQRPSPSRGRG
jgi:hypothetical protein